MLTENGPKSESKSKKSTKVRFANNSLLTEITAKFRVFMIPMDMFHLMPEADHYAVFATAINTCDG